MRRENCWAEEAPGGIGDLDEDEAAAPLRVVVQHALHRQQLQLNALEQVHVVHADQHHLPLELHSRTRAASAMHVRYAHLPQPETLRKCAIMG